MEPVSVIPNAILTLNCWVRGVDVGRYNFPMEISRTETVAALKEAINEKNLICPNDFALALYKPKRPVTISSTESISTLILSEHAEHLALVRELSEVFPEPPPKHDIHIIVDVPHLIHCYLRGADLDSSFSIAIRPDEDIYRFLLRVKNAKEDLKNVANRRIRLYKITGDDDELLESLRTTGAGTLLRGTYLAPNFLDVPVLEPLRVAVEVSSVSLIPLQQSIPEVQQESNKYSSDLENFEDIFVKVRYWGMILEFDVDKNKIKRTEAIPDFVIIFEQKLDRKPRLPGHLSGMHTLGILEDHFEHSQGSTPEDRPQEAVREADLSEVLLTTFHTSINWDGYWPQLTSGYSPYTSEAMDTMFFIPFLATNKAAADCALLKDEKWPVSVVLKNRGELRQHHPRSAFHILKSDLPRLVVELEVPSPGQSYTDSSHMLTTGAFIVRFANKFVSTFEGRKFVLCAIFVEASGYVSRFTLFQNQVGDEVYYHESRFSLCNADGRFKFARLLYNFHAELGQEPDSVAKGVVLELNNAIKENCLKTAIPDNRMYSDNGLESVYSDESKAGGSNRDHAQLSAHGYKVRPDVFVDESGGEWSSLCQRPDHVLIVYRPTKPDKEYIAKKVREELNELKIFKFLDAIPLKSEHVISLVDSFNGWAILPKMTTVQDYVEYRVVPDVFATKLYQVCVGLIKGLAYLHEHRIAHRDIKPENLVVDRNYSLKIIDFDSAVQVEDEEEKVSGQRGTEGWMAPEVDKKLKHSPIKADRWACGEVILFLFHRFTKEDKILVAFARDLAAHNPEDRPPLLAWGKYLALSRSDCRNVGNPEASEDQMDWEAGEDMKSPDAKKQRLS